MVILLRSAETSLAEILTQNRKLSLCKIHRLSFRKMHRMPPRRLYLGVHLAKPLQDLEGVPQVRVPEVLLEEALGLAVLHKLGPHVLGVLPHLEEGPVGGNARLGISSRRFSFTDSQFAG